MQKVMLLYAMGPDMYTQQRASCSSAESAQCNECQVAAMLTACSVTHEMSRSTVLSMLAVHTFKATAGLPSDHLLIHACSASPNPQLHSGAAGGMPGQ